MTVLEFFEFLTKKRLKIRKNACFRIFLAEFKILSYSSVFFLQFLEKPEFDFLRNIEFPDNFGLSFGRILEFRVHARR